MHPRFSKCLLTTAALIALAARPAAAGPEGGTVVGGAATIQGQGGPAVVVNQSSNSAIINWHTFNIGARESVRFNQPGSSSVVLNRVTGGLGPSEILGTLTANGRVFLINRDGILFGPSAVVNTAGFLASTHDIRDADFMAGRYNFNIPGRPDASIVNQGRITATSGGFAALVAPGVRNTGTITATLGTVALVSGNGFTLDLYGDKLITLAVGDQIASKVIDVSTGRPLKSLVSNEGKIRANGGRVELTAAAARTVVDSVINTSGMITANSIGRRNGGKVVLWSDSETTFAGTILARGGAKGGDGGFVEVSSHRLLNYSGTTDTRAPKGTVGTLLLDPENLYVNANGLPPRTDPTASAISANALVNQLASNNVVLSTQPSGTHAGDIFFDANVSWSTGNSLTLSAFHDILFMSGSKVTDQPALSGPGGMLV